jgi:hypothetical protein
MTPQKFKDETLRTLVDIYLELLTRGAFTVLPGFHALTRPRPSGSLCRGRE